MGPDRKVAERRHILDMARGWKLVETMEGAGAGRGGGGN